MKNYFLFLTLLTILITGCVLIKCTMNKNEQNKIASQPSDKEMLSENSNEKYYDVSTYITDEVLNNSYNNCSTIIFRNSYTPEFLLENSDIIALVTIVSIDGASTDYNSMFGMTYGNMLINNIIYGDDLSGQLLSYIKPGGIISLDDWEKAQPITAREKREYLRKQSVTDIDPQNTYLKVLIDNDIYLEAGKTYLAYLNYSNSFQKYEIIGLGNGLREVNTEQRSRISVQNFDISSLKIKNNNTDEWENLNNYIQENINKKEQHI